MGWRLGKAVLALPGVVLVLVPGVILWATCGTDAAAHLPGPADPGLWVGAVFGLGGLALAIWTVRLFVAGGEGTPAPWDPPHKLVVRGPYRHVRNAASERGMSSRDIISGAGHDACNVAAVAPTAMIFIPCIDGISHNEDEDVKPEWVTAGAQVLLGAMLEKAGAE